MRGQLELSSFADVNKNMNNPKGCININDIS